MKLLLILMMALVSKEALASISSPAKEDVFAFIQSEVGASETFLLNRFNGSVYLMARDKKGSLVWDRIPSNERTKSYSSASYIFYSSNRSASQTFLVDTKSGKTWQVQADKNNSLILNSIDNSQLGDLR